VEEILTYKLERDISSFVNRKLKMLSSRLRPRLLQSKRDNKYE
jgi:hypothetical protein